MGITTADYKVLSDDTVKKIKFGDDAVPFTFNPANDIVLNNLGADRPILTYFIDPSHDAKDLRLEVFVVESDGGKQSINTWTLNGTISRSISEPFHHNLLSTGNNTLLFEVTNGEGSVKIQNVIVWYKRN